VPVTGEVAEHFGGFSWIARFSKEAAVEHDDRIRPDYQAFGARSRNCDYFSACYACDIIRGRFIRVSAFDDLACCGFERDSEVSKQVSASGGR
jgi:hypothetical protein